MESAITEASPHKSSPETGRRRLGQFGDSKRSKQTSDDIVSLLAILAPLVRGDTHLSSEAESLILSNPPVSDLEAFLPELASCISNTLQNWALDLTRLTRPSANPSNSQRYIPAMAADLSKLKDEIHISHQSTLDSRLQSLVSLSELQETYTEVLVLLAQCIETKHGPITTSLEFRAKEASLLAQTTEVEAKRAIDTLYHEFYSPKMVSALQNYTTHLEDAKTRAKERVRNVQRSLEQYGVGAEDGGEKEQLMRELARARNDITRQVDEVTRDLRRLQTS